ncbi:hypothetical protein D1013_15170 [Euzebyella marina]|uniref:Uncharacterized protein n=1 Tax=Euzebyella marina TaxID=1761453 RepID=A0A3G2L8N1_9FLAO|nr:hypothetical protein [Euzebyella marina]AYN68622.1 hypothetical protein D1013_15170 [Euzebyella marina]
MLNRLYFIFLLVPFLFLSCYDSNGDTEKSATLPIYQDTPYLQDYSVKYYFNSSVSPKKVFEDRNGVVQVLGKNGLYRTSAGQFLVDGTLIADNTYRPLKDKSLNGISLFQDQFVYVDDKAVLSNAWAGNLFLPHDLENANLLEPGSNFDFLISDGKELQFLSKDKAPWKGTVEDGNIIQIRYGHEANVFWILGKNSVSTFDASNNQIKTIKINNEATSFDVVGAKLYIGTQNGYFTVDSELNGKPSDLINKLPVPSITWIESIDEEIWFGSDEGAYRMDIDGDFNYYYGKRWLPGNKVVHISSGHEGRVHILTDNGLAQIHFDPMTLADKAAFYEKQVRDRHIRLGFNASLVDLKNGDVNSGRLDDSDNDGLWTSMYLASQVYRYKVTGNEEALKNCYESMEAMERLFTINDVPGFPSRSFERSGYIESLHDSDRWQHTDDPEWDWKSTTSSDEAIGHIFVYSVMAELLENDLRERAITLIDTLMGHIVKNDYYLVDFDGKPTTWGKWNPEYVNARPIMVGDRKINSSNIIAMLQTAYHFTQKEVYKEKAFDLMNNHGYFENLMRPMSEIGKAPEDADDWSKMLSEGWNHSDDEMYFLGYWGLYRYALNDTLKTKFKESIIDHWESERPEKDGAWNLLTAVCETQNFDLDEAAWYLREHPMDMRSWDVKNSHRKDLTFIEPNFRDQTTEEVLPPDERQVQRHNANMFRLDRTGGDGSEEYSAGDIWLLPYWLGRYLGVISEPRLNKE